MYTKAMHLLAPDLANGIHNWRDGKRLIKEGLKLYIEGTDTLAGRFVFNSFFELQQHCCLSIV